MSSELAPSMMDGVAPDAVIDMEGLLDELQAGKTEVDRYTSSQQTAVAARETQYREAVTAFEESKKATSDELSRLDERAASTRAKHTQQKMDISDCRAEIAQLQVEEQSLPAHIEVLKAEESKQLENIASATAAANEKAKEHAFERNQLTRGIVFYKRLGLGLESMEVGEGEGGRMRMVFTRLDERDPDREFSFVLTVSADRQFEMTECEPPLSGIAELCAKLKADSNLPLFVVGMRKHFKQLIAREEYK